MSDNQNYNEEYSKMTKEASPSSPKLKNGIFAFLIGGFICCFGEFIKQMFLYYGFNLDDAAAYVSIILIVLTAILTGLGIFGKIAKTAGAGTLVPITGFANAVVSPAMEFQSEGRILGTGAKMFIIAGPVIVYSSAATFIYGIIYYFFIR